MQDNSGESQFYRALLIQEALGPFIVDYAIRQAIMHCWLRLPEDERTVAKVKSDIHRHVERGLRDLEEDAKAFGFTIGATEEASDHEARLAAIRTRYAKAYEPWSEEEDQLLKLRHEDGASIDELADNQQRQPGAISSRLRKLDLST